MVYTEGDRLAPTLPGLLLLAYGANPALPFQHTIILYFCDVEAAKPVVMASTRPTSWIFLGISIELRTRLFYSASGANHAENFRPAT